MRWKARSRTITVVVASMAAATVLSACGSDPERNVPGPNYGTVTGAGRKVDFPAQVDRADYPNACRLMTDDSMRALIGAPVTRGRTTAGCAWTSGDAALPTVALQFVEIGEDASSVYTERRPGGTAARGPPQFAPCSHSKRTASRNRTATTRCRNSRDGRFE